MQNSSEIVSQIDTLVHSEVGRLQQFVPGKDIFGHSGKSIDEIITDIKSVLVDSTGSIDIAYNVPWMTQVSLKRGIGRVDLRADNPNQVYYPVNPSTNLPITSSIILNYLISNLPDDWIFNWFVRNIDDIGASLEGLAGATESRQDIMILSNHATWFNLPLIAHCLHRFLHIPKENLYTVLGPAITHSHWSTAGIIRYSNLLKTYPDTPKANTGYPSTKRIQENFLRAIRDIFASENTTPSSRVLLLSPSGTTDTILEDGSIMMAQPSSGTGVLVQMLMRRMNLLGFVMGVNDTNIIPVGESRPRVGNVFCAIERVGPKNWKEKLSQSILDQHGESIGNWSSLD